MADFVYPTYIELLEIERLKMPRLTEDRLGFQIVPIVNVDHHNLRWEQQDNYTGLQQLRGLGGPPTRVKQVGGRAFEMQPGVYGEFMTIDETELTLRRPFGQLTGRIDIGDLVAERQDRLLQRRLDRIEQIIWSLLTTGTFSVSGPSGVVHTDTFTLQTFNSTVGWDVPATSRPLGDFRSVALLGRGTNTRFGASATAIMNQVTLNAMLANTNPNDLGGKNGPGFAVFLSMDEVQRYMTRNDLPNIIVYDDGYHDDAGTFQLYVPDYTVIVIGQRPSNARIAEYRMTFNANRPDMGSGPYTFVKDEQIVPRAPEVHDGHNGGPVIFYPGAVVVMDVKP